MPKERFEHAHKGILLKCAPLQLQSGGWAPTLYISDHRNRSEVSEFQVFIKGAPESCETQREAADIALAVGIKWADDNA